MKIHDELMNLGIKPRNWNEEPQKIKCPQCQPPHNPRDNPLSLTLNQNGFVFKCHHCDFKGGFKENGARFVPTKPKIVKPQEPSQMLQTDDLTNYFTNRGISIETLKALNIHAEDKWYAFPYYDKDGSLTNIKFRDKNKNFRQSANAKRTLYNYNNCYRSDTVVFVEGEIDVLSVYESGIKSVCTLPDGAAKEARYKKGDARFKALENCPLEAKKIILFTDKDEAGRSLHKELLHRFGKDRCWYVKCPDDCKDANDILTKHGTLKLKELIDNAIPYPVDGLYRARDYYNQVNDLYDGNYVKPLEIGMGDLDRIYKILPSTFHTITGIPNHGKSVFLDQVLMNLAMTHGWKFAVFSPEHSTSMHIRRIAQMYKEKPFDIGFENRMDKSELNDAMSFIDKHFYFIETKDAVPNIQLIMEIATNAVNKYGINGIIIDPYNEVNATRSGNQREDEHIRDFISTCKRFTRLYETVVWVVAHPTKLPKSNDGSYMPPSAYDISGASHWHNQSDVVITVHRDFDDNSTRVITRKIREQDLYGKIGEVKFIYDEKSKKFIEFEPYDDWSSINFN